MRTLVISDIHANIDALRAIGEPFDRVICLGDLVDYGPEPAAVIAALRKMGAERVRGNHDNAVAFRMDCGCGEAFKHLSVATRQYMWSVLDEPDVAWLGDAPTSLATEIDGRRVLAVHAAPSDHLFKYLTPDTPTDELAEEMSQADADIVLTGHSHRPFVREFGERLLVNAGSVGQPRDGDPRAGYAIIENGEVRLGRVAYDVEAAAAKVMALPLDGLVREQLAHILRNASTPPV